jgi:hypothetical protein
MELYDSNSPKESGGFDEAVIDDLNNNRDYDFLQREHGCLLFQRRRQQEEVAAQEEMARSIESLAVDGDEEATLESFSFPRRFPSYDEESAADEVPTPRRDSFSSFFKSHHQQPTRLSNSAKK